MVKSVIWEAKCPFCKSKSEVVIPIKGYNKWVGGVAVQNAFPELSADDRELLITGMCRDCNKKIFGGN